MEKKEILEILYWVSLVIWVVTLFITVCTGFSLPMWLACVVMNGFNVARIFST